VDHRKRKPTSCLHAIFQSSPELSLKEFRPMVGAINTSWLSKTVAIELLSLERAVNERRAVEKAGFPWAFLTSAEKGPL